MLGTNALALPASYTIGSFATALGQDQIIEVSGSELVIVKP